ncbi:MAG: VTT domain-containing protein [Candidatus Paceibacterota bacterium]
MDSLYNIFDIQMIIATYGYVGIFLIVFLESGLIFFLPGDSLLFTAGILAAAGVLNIMILLPLIFISTLIGGIMGYLIGVHLERIRKYTFLSKILRKEYIDKAHIFFTKYGKSAVLYSRFVPIVRTFVPIVAGIVRMDYSSFMKYNLMSSLLWTFVATLAGYFLGHTFPWIKDYISILVIIVVVLSFIPPIVEIARNKRTKKN